MCIRDSWRRSGRPASQCHRACTRQLGPQPDFECHAFGTGGGRAWEAAQPLRLGVGDARGVEGEQPSRQPLREGLRNGATPHHTPVLCSCAARRCGARARPHACTCVCCFDCACAVPALLGWVLQDTVSRQVAQNRHSASGGRLSLLNAGHQAAQYHLTEPDLHSSPRCVSGSHLLTARRRNTLVPPACMLLTGTKRCSKCGRTAGQSGCAYLGTRRSESSNARLQAAHLKALEDLSRRTHVRKQRI